MFYKETSEKAIRHFDSSLEGLSQMEVMKRLKKNGLNELREKEKTPTWKLFLESFKDPLVIILLVAALVQIF